MIPSIIQKNIRIIGTILLALFVIIFYTLSYTGNQKPKSAQFDIVSGDVLEDFEPFDMLKFWGLSNESMSLFTIRDLERFSGVIEKFQHRNDIRRNKRQRIIRYLLKNYDLTESEARILVRSADINARKYKIDLELLLAIIFVESTYKPRAESVVGAIGLMQVVPKWHLDKISKYGDPDVLYDIRANIAIGTEILMEYVYKEGNLRAALHRYNGSKDDKTLKYSNRVFKKYEELKSKTYMENARLKYDFDIISEEL